MAIRDFTLFAGFGSTTMPDGNTFPVWGFSTTPGRVVVPAPTLTVNEGDWVRLTLRNMTMMEHTIHPHGLDVDTLNDGVPHTSFTVPPMGSYTYQFTARHAGTYAYHCHVNTVLHQQMGMYGAFIVMPADGSQRAWTGGPAFDKQYVWVLSEFDSAWHRAAGMMGGPPVGNVNFASYNPDYFLINGKADPETLSDASTAIVADRGQRVLVRLINMGYLNQRVSLGALLFRVIASDGRPLPRSYEASRIVLAPGERYDVLVAVPQEPGVHTAQVDYLSLYDGSVLGVARTQIRVA